MPPVADAEVTYAQPSTFDRLKAERDADLARLNAGAQSSFAAAIPLINADRDRAMQQQQIDQQNAQAEQNRQWAQNWYAEQQAGWDQAKTESKADRDRMVGLLDEFRAGLDDSWMNGHLDRERAYWDTKVNQDVQVATQQMAAMGRTASPYLLGEIRRRGWAQASDALFLRRMDLEKERRTAVQWYLSSLDQVYSNTQRTMADPTAAAQMMLQIGAGSPTTQALR